MTTDVTREDLDSRGAPTVEALENPPVGWEDKQFYLRQFGGRERDAWEIWSVANSWSKEEAKAGRGKAYHWKPGATPRGMLVALTLCDKDGKLLYDARDPADVAECASRAGPLLDWLDDEARRINGLGVKAEEDAAKNSDSDGSEDTGCSSPSSSDTGPSENVKTE